MKHFEIVARLPGLNEYTKANRNNKFGGAKMKAEAEETIGVFCNLEPIRTPVWIRFDWTEAPNRGRYRDPDNIAFAKKFILDCMVKKGILPDDSMTWVKGFQDRIQKGKICKCEIYIYEEGEQYDTR